MSMDLKGLATHITHIGVPQILDQQGVTADNVALIKQCVTQPEIYAQAEAAGLFNPGSGKDLTITYVSEYGTAPEAKVVKDGLEDGYILKKGDLPIMDDVVVEEKTYKFVAWMNGDTPAAPKDKIMENTTLTAAWEEVELEVAPEGPESEDPAPETEQPEAEQPEA